MHHDPSKREEGKKKKHAKVNKMVVEVRNRNTRASAHRSPEEVYIY